MQRSHVNVESHLFYVASGVELTLVGGLPWEMVGLQQKEAHSQSRGYWSSRDVLRDVRTGATGGPDGTAAEDTYVGSGAHQR